MEIHIYLAVSRDGHWFSQSQEKSIWPITGTQLRNSRGIFFLAGRDFATPLLTVKSKTFSIASLEDGFADKSMMLEDNPNFLGIFIGPITYMDTWPKPPFWDRFHKRYSLPQAWGSSLHFLSYVLHLIQRRSLLLWSDWFLRLSQGVAVEALFPVDITLF